jgi:hypothetical protein
MPMSLMLMGLVLVAALAVATLVVSVVLHRQSLQQSDRIQRQLELQVEARQTQNLVLAVDMLRDQDFRTAMMVVRNRMRGRPYTQWDTADALHVMLVCSTFNLVALMVKQELLQRELLLEHWGQSAVDAWEALSAFIEAKQDQNPFYCADFQWLYAQARVHRRSEAPSREMPLPAVGGGPRRKA